MALEDTEPVPVLAGHLRELMDVLDFAYSAQAAEDIIRTSRNLDPRDKRQSRLTTGLQNQLQRFESYLEEAEREPESVDDDD